VALWLSPAEEDFLLELKDANFSETIATIADRRMLLCGIQLLYAIFADT